MDLFVAQNPEEAGAAIAPPMEHRWGSRRPCKVRVHLTAGAGISGLGRLRDISISGAFLETTLPLPVFAQIEIDVVQRNGTLRVLEFPAVVVRHDTSGVGIEWCDPNPRDICCKLGCSVQCDYQP